MMSALKCFLMDDKVDRVLTETYFQAFEESIFPIQEKKAQDKDLY